jgi:hypothetical protein
MRRTGPCRAESPTATLTKSRHDGGSDCPLAIPGIAPLVPHREDLIHQFFGPWGRLRAASARSTGRAVRRL